MQNLLTISWTYIIIHVHGVPVAQLDRASASGAEGRAFESPQAHHPTFRSHLVLSRIAFRLSDIIQLYS